MSFSVGLCVGNAEKSEKDRKKFGCTRCWIRGKNGIYTTHQVSLHFKNLNFIYLIDLLDILAFRY